MRVERCGKRGAQKGVARKDNESVFHIFPPTAASGIFNNVLAREPWSLRSLIGFNRSWFRPAAYEDSSKEWRCHGISDLDENGFSSCHQQKRSRRPFVPSRGYLPVATRRVLQAPVVTEALSLSEALPQRKSVSLTHMRCRITASLRATATRAF